MTATAPEWHAEVEPLAACGLGYLRLSQRTFAENYEFRIDTEMSGKESAEDGSCEYPKGAVLVPNEPVGTFALVLADDTPCVGRARIRLGRRQIHRPTSSSFNRGVGMRLAPGPLKWKQKVSSSCSSPAAHAVTTSSRPAVVSRR